MDRKNDSQQSTPEHGSPEQSDSNFPRGEVEQVEIEQVETIVETPAVSLEKIAETKNARGEDSSPPLNAQARSLSQESSFEHVLDASTPTEFTETNGVATHAPQKKMSKGKKISLAVGGVIVVAALVVGGLIFSDVSLKSNYDNLVAQQHEAVDANVKIHDEVGNIFGANGSANSAYNTLPVYGQKIASAPTELVSQETKDAVAKYTSENLMGDNEMPARTADPKFEKAQTRDQVEVTSDKVEALKKNIEEIKASTANSEKEFKEQTAQAEKHDKDFRGFATVITPAANEILANRDAFMTAYGSADATEFNYAIDSLRKELEIYEALQAPTYFEIEDYAYAVGDASMKGAALLTNHNTALAAQAQAEAQAQEQAQAPAQDTTGWLSPGTNDQPLWGNGGTQVPDNSGGGSAAPAPAPTPYIPPAYDPTAAPTDPCVATNTCIRPNF